MYVWLLYYLILFIDTHLGHHVVPEAVPSLLLDTVAAGKKHLHSICSKGPGVYGILFLICLLPFLALCVLTRANSPGKVVSLAGNASLELGINGTREGNESVKPPSVTEIPCTTYEELRLRLLAINLGLSRPTSQGVYPPEKVPKPIPLKTCRQSQGRPPVRLKGQLSNS
uniref:Uncharacterized protein n=1 Tax=Myotis myotis TaxID=51298 RepID=A0A7J7XHF9_MYOMY|nr:hypothetical protein mMyoMyo1_011713 [Myotis myotis]